MSLNVEVEEVVDLAGSSGSPEQVIRRTMANSGQTTLLILAQKRGQMKATQHQQQHPLLPMIKTQRPKLSSIPKAARQRPIASAETTTQDIHNKVISSARRFGSAGVILVPKSARTQDGGEVHPVSGRLTGQALVPHPPVKAVPGPMIPAPPAAANPRRTTQHAMLPGVYVVRSQERPKPAAVETKLATPVISKALVPQSAGASGTRPNSPTHGTPRRQPLLRKPLIKLPATEDSCVQLIKKNKSKKLEPVSSEVIRNRVPAIMPAPGYVSPEGRRNSTLAQYPLMRRISGEPLKAAILPSRNETITSAGPKHLSPITKDSGDMPLVERIKSSKKKCARAIEPPPQPVYQQEFVTERVEVMPDLTSRPRPAAAGVRVRPSSRPPGPQPYRSSSPHLQRPSTTEHTGMGTCMMKSRHRHMLRIICFLWGDSAGNRWINLTQRPVMSGFGTLLLLSSLSLLFFNKFSGKHSSCGDLNVRDPWRVSKVFYEQHIY